MIKKNIPYIFTVVYFLLCLITMNLSLDNNKALQLYVKPFIPLTLFLFYFFSVKKVNKIYSLMLLFALIAHLFIIFRKEYFLVCLLSYLIFHFLSIILVYKDFLIRKSIFNIFTFALPFFMAFITIFLLIYKNLYNDLIPIFLFGIVVAINGSITLLNYAQKQNVVNYLIFIGLFTIIAADACASLYMYGKEDILFYFLLILFDQFGQYAICRGLILKQKKGE